MPKQRLSSRLANKQKKEMTKQTVVLILLSIVIGLVFLLIILPNGVRLFFEIFDRQTDLSQTEMIPPQPPRVAAPPSFTNQDEVELIGYAEAESQIQVEVNNQKQKALDVDESGQFSLKVRLNDGENTVRLISVDSYGNESRPQIVTIVKDKQKPDIVINFPEDGAEFKTKDDEVIQLQGETKPRARVYVNDRLSYAGADGIFSARVRLSRGENVIEIRVVDQAGNEAEKEIKVNYRF